MSERNFRDLLEKRWAKGYFVCVGLDTDRSKISQAVEKSIGYLNSTQDMVMFAFNMAVVGPTHEMVCAYKLNAAFYEQFGMWGMHTLKKTIEEIHIRAPDVPVILDYKRADIGNTNDGYVKSAFDYYDADAVTVNPYFGREALMPFLNRVDKGIIILCRTSNPGAGEFQDLKVDGTPLYQIVARNVAEQWNTNGNCALVVGATCPEELGEVRRIVGDMPILIPGVGAQGGDVEKTVQAGKDSRGTGMIINSSRGIIFASQEADFAEAAQRETEKLHNLITKCLL